MRACPAVPAKRHRYTIIVDAGHGGVDNGMTGPLGGGPKIYEKNITLAVATKLGDQLESRGVDVVYTRTRDTLIALDDRGKIANRAAGSLFISIHVNAANPNWKDPRGSRGFETYFLSEARTEDARRVEQMENDAVKFEASQDKIDKDDPLSFILSDMQQNMHLRESSDLAEGIQRRLGRMHPGPSRGVKQAGFRVLVTAYMPAVLVEIGFGTNPSEAAFISDPAKQNAIAAAIADAAMEYLGRYEGPHQERHRSGQLAVTTGAPLRTVVSNLIFQNPIVLAAGTAGYGEELTGVMRPERLGGLVTKAVSLEPRHGAPSPRVAEFAGGMINAVGLANPGLEEVRRERLPWLAAHLPATRKIVNVVGFSVEEYPAVVAGIEEGLAGATAGAVDAFELNVSCPNTKAGGLEFGADPASLRAVVEAARRETRAAGVREAVARARRTSATRRASRPMPAPTRSAS